MNRPILRQMMDTESKAIPEPLRTFDRLEVGLASTLNHLDDLAGRVRQGRLCGSILPNTLEAARIELTYHSNAIEGSTLSLRDTQLVIEGKTPAGEKSLREIYEARNHDRALRQIEQCAAEKSAAPITEKDLLDIHALVLADISPDSAGRFRSGRVRIAGTGFVPPGAQHFDLLIPQTLALAHRAGVHPVLQAAELHYNLVAIHPFNDGNGRTARLMMNYHLLQHGYPCSIIPVTRRGEYLLSLDEANQGRTEPFARFVLETMIQTMEMLLIE